MIAPVRSESYFDQQHFGENNILSSKLIRWLFSPDLLRSRLFCCCCFLGWPGSTNKPSNLRIKLKPKTERWWQIYLNRCNKISDGDDQPEEVHEDVDDVQVDGERGKDVLLGRDRILVVPAHHHLNIVLAWTPPGYFHPIPSHTTHPVNGLCMGWAIVWTSIWYIGFTVQILERVVE